MQFNIRAGNNPGGNNNPLDADFEGLTEYFIYTPHSYQKNQYGSVAVTGQQKMQLSLQRCNCILHIRISRS